MSRGKKVIVGIIGFVVPLIIGGMGAPQTVTRETQIEPQLLSHYAYVDKLGFYTIVGEVQNTLETNRGPVLITAIFYDAEKKIIEAYFGITDIEILKPGQKSPFEVSSYPDELQPSSFKLKLTFGQTTGEPFEGLAINSNTPSIDQRGYHKIVGEVQNNGARQSTYVKVVCTYYDADGKVIGKSFSFTNPQEIGVGQAAPFELSSFPYEITPARYEVQVEGR